MYYPGLFGKQWIWVIFNKLPGAIGYITIPHSDNFNYDFIVMHPLLIDYRQFPSRFLTNSDLQYLSGSWILILVWRGTIHLMTFTKDPITFKAYALFILFTFLNDSDWIMVISKHTLIVQAEYEMKCVMLLVLSIPSLFVKWKTIIYIFNLINLFIAKIQAQLMIHITRKSKAHQFCSQNFR